MRFGFFGIGNMATLLSRKIHGKHYYYTPSGGKAQTLAQQSGGVYCAQWEGLLDADAIVLGHKPQQLSEVAGEVGDRFSDKVVISMLAGATLETLSAKFSTDKVARMMPNTPVGIGQGVTTWVFTDAVNSVERELILKGFSHTGTNIEVHSEDELRAITPVNGCGPALVFEFAKVMSERLVAQGIDLRVATEITLGTIIGSAQKAQMEDLELDQQIAAVTSKGGVTIEILESMRKQGFRKLMDNAFESGAARSRELAKS